MILDDFTQPHPHASGAGAWSLSSDRVMGGVSDGTMTRETMDGRAAIVMRGEVRLENNGGFLQMGFDLTPQGDTRDVSGFSGLDLDVLGNGETYNVHLRTTDLTRPWQSWRQGFRAIPRWQTVRLAFEGFEAHRTGHAFDPARLRRISVAAIGRAFAADIAVSRIILYP